MVTLRSIQKKDSNFVKQALTTLWGSEEIVYSGKVFIGSELRGFLAEENGKVVGLVTYVIQNNACHIISLNSLTPGKGIGTALIDSVRKTVQEKKCHRLFVITTNDNTSAIKFYQKKGFIIKAIYKDAVEKSRKIKPQIPEFGENGIPLKDEIELEMTV